MDMNRFKIIKEIGTLIHEDNYISPSELIWKDDNFIDFKIILYSGNIFLIKEINEEIRMVKVIKPNGIVLSFNETYGAEK